MGRDLSLAPCGLVVERVETEAAGLLIVAHPARGSALGFREQTFGSQPGFQPLLEFPKPGRRLLFPAIDRFTLGPAMLANRGTGQFQVTRDRADALLADQTTAPDLGNHIHEQHPRFSSAKAG